MSTNLFQFFHWFKSGCRSHSKGWFCGFVFTDVRVLVSGNSRPVEMIFLTEGTNVGVADKSWQLFI